MIEYIRGDLLTTSDKYIAHGCNAEGVFNSGVAKAIRNKYPKAYHDYLDVYKDCKQDDGPLERVPVLLGDIFGSEQPDGKTIIHCITQLSFGRNPNVRYVSYDAVDNCMRNLAGCLKERGSDTVSMPKIGSGLGNGKWSVIEEIINHRLDTFLVKVYYLE